MKRKTQTEQAEAQSRTEPTNLALEALAKIPEDVQKMAIVFAYGLEASKRKTA